MANNAKITGAKRVGIDNKFKIVFQILTEETHEQTKWLTDKQFKNIAQGMSPFSYIGGRYSDTTLPKKAGDTYVSSDGSIETIKEDGYYTDPLSVALTPNADVLASLNVREMDLFNDELLLKSIAKAKLKVAPVSDERVEKNASDIKIENKTSKV